MPCRPPWLKGASGMAAACARAAPERMRRIGVLVNFAQADREGQAGVAAFVATPKEHVHGSRTTTTLPRQGRDPQTSAYRRAPTRLTPPFALPPAL